ncbi:MAG: DUF4062 domain-containing protein, partial [Candidatus Aminicenantales bacterium]
MPKQTPHIFVSATTKGLKGYREETDRVLGQKGILAVIQEEFDTDYRTIRTVLKEKITDCDGVICLIGPFYGIEPKNRPKDEPRRSYTQLEFFIARELDKPVYRFIAKDCAEFASVEAEPSDIARLQQEFISQAKKGDEPYYEFHDKAGLRELVLRIAVPPHDPERRPSNLPYDTIGSLFKGRDEILEELHRRLSRKPAGAAIIKQKHAIHGLGGVGKTRLAIEYAFCHAANYIALLFITADTPENLRRNMAMLCESRILNLSERGACEEEIRVAAAIGWLQEHSGWLLIIDGADTEVAAEAVEEILDGLKGGTILVTSRFTEWSAGVETLDLDVLDEKAAVDFLLERTAGRRRQMPYDEADALALARELGGLALALEQAGAYVHEKRCSLAEYLGFWQKKDQAVREWYDARLMKYPRSVATTWNTTIDQLSPAARSLLSLLSWLTPDPIPRNLKPEGELHEALVELSNYSFVKMEAGGNAFRIHGLVQDISRERQKKKEQIASLKAVLEILNAAAQGNPSDVRTWTVWDPLRPHIRGVIGYADGMGIVEPTTQLVGQLALLLYAKAIFSEAEPLMRRALAIDEKSYGPDHPEVATDLNNLAQLLQDTNRL